MPISNKRDINLIEHILEYCKQVEATVLRFGNDFNEFSSDVIFRNAVGMPIFQIGELSGELSDEFKETHSTIVPWKQIRGMRNLFAHNYIGMDIKKIWDTATIDVPALKTFCTSVLDEVARQSSADVQENKRTPKKHDDPER